MNKNAKTILLIDDDTNLRRALYKFLLSSGYNVVDYDNPNEAINFVLNSSTRPDLIVVDYLMPGCMCGIEVADILKRNQLTANIPIVLISANNLECSSYVFLRKPLKQTELDETIKKCLYTVQM